MNVYWLSLDHRYPIQHQWNPFFNTRAMRIRWCRRVYPSSCTLAKGSVRRSLLPSCWVFGKPPFLSLSCLSGCQCIECIGRVEGTAFIPRATGWITGRQQTNSAACRRKPTLAPRRTPTTHVYAVCSFEHYMMFTVCYEC